MSDTLAIEIAKLLGEALKENGAMEAKIKNLEPAHYNLLKQVEMLTQSRDAMQNQRDRAQRELRVREEQEPKFRALFETADALRRASRGFKTLHPLGDKLNKALAASKDCIDWIPF